MPDASLPTTPAPGDLLLVTDELGAPADFVLYRALSSHVKTSGPSARAVIVSAQSTRPTWTAVLAKSNVNLPQLAAAGRVAFVELASTHLAPRDGAELRSLRPVYDELRGAIGDADGALVVLDDLATLEWIGVPSVEVARFARAVCALCRTSNAALIIRHHIVTPGELDELLRLLLQLCTYRIDVFPLSSGRSGSVSGQVALHAGAAQAEASFRAIPRGGALLYRLTDAGALFFERGTGAGVL